MRNTALATILLAAGMALAQTSATPSTVQGCLSGASGSYTFTDQSGKSWTLTGSTDNLKDHVGNTVEITGNEDTTNNTISVSDVKDVSQGCNQTATSSMGQTASTTAAGTETSATAATQPSSGMESGASAGAQTSTTAGTQPDYAPQGTQATPNPQTSAQDQSTANPQESNTETGQAATPTSTTGNSVQGCLAGSMGSFSITDQSGKTWTLTGNADELQKHVGNTVQITGTQDTTNNSITVSNVTDVSQGCQQGAAGISNQQTGTTSAAGTTGTQPGAVSPAPTTTAEVTQPGTNPEEAPGTNTQDIRKNPAQSDIPSGQPQIDATNNPPTFGTEQNPAAQTTQNQQTTTTAAAPSSSTSATTTEQQPSATEQNPSAQSTEPATTTEQNPSMTAQSTEPSTAEQPSAEPSTSATTTEQNEQATTEQSEPAATEQNEQANQPATASETANQNAATEQGTAAANRGQLPQTASPLPLLLLLGIGSLAGAFLAFRRVKA